MARRKESGIDVIAKLPWPAGIILGVMAYGGIRYGIGWLLRESSNPLLAGLGKLAASGIYAPLAWMALAVCWIGAFGAWLGGRRRKRLLETQTGLDSLRAMSWRAFEMLVGEAFRRRGYAVQETGLGGADGGIDLILRKDGKTTLVQCKQWKTQRVDVKVVREMYGLLAHHDAAAVKIVAVGDYTAEARHFAQGKPIELIHGQALLAMVRSVQTSTPLKVSMATGHSPATTSEAAPVVPATPVCPKCGSLMVLRSNRQTRNRFWGCASYPACRGTRAA